MQPKVPIGPSTLALLISALGAVGAFVTEWSQSGTPSPWLAILAAALPAILGVLRSWQATWITAKTAAPADATDVAEEEIPADYIDPEMP